MGEEEDGQGEEAGFPPSPRTWSAVLSEGTAGRAHPLSDIDPATPATHRSDHTHWPLLLSGARCPELKVTMAT